VLDGQEIKPATGEGSKGFQQIMIGIEGKWFTAPNELRAHSATNRFYKGGQYNRLGGGDL